MFTSLLTDVADAGTAIGVLFAGSQLWLSRRQAKTDFEDRMTETYRAIAAQLPVEAFFSDAEIDAATIRAKRRVFYRYFDLCNEQAFLWRQHRIQPRTWAEWEDGIRGNMCRESFDRAWYEEIEPHIGEDFQDFKEVLRKVDRPVKRGRPLSDGRPGVALSAVIQPADS